MDKIAIDLILKARQLSDRPFEATLKGISMNPVLYEGDIIRIKHMHEYRLGDIIAFKYKNEGLLAHRLLELKDSRYFCKGDNSFRLEAINKDQIIGKIINIMRDGEEIKLPPCSKALISLSKAVNNEFVRQNNNIKATKMSTVYILYKQIFLNEGDVDKMLYVKNKNMDYISEDEQNLVIFNPDNGNALFIDETGIDILNLLDAPIGMDGILDELVKLYDTSEDEIRSDVEEFLFDLIEKKVVDVV